MKRHSQQGFFLVLAVIFIMVIGAMGVVISYLFSNRAAFSVAQQNGLSAFYSAESALDIGTRLLTRPDLSNRIACASITGTAAITNAALNDGTFTDTTVNSSPIFAANTLSASQTASDTVISLTSSAGFAANGRIMIDSELIDYAAISGNTLIGATRGVAGTTATTHASGAAVGQYQCTLDAQAGIPNLTSPTYKRELQWGVQLQDGWLVGNRTGTTRVYGRWNYGTEEAWNYNGLATGSNVDTNAVFTLSYADAWAAGSAISSNLGTYHWNGASWSLQAPGTAVNAIVYGLYCLKSNDCWAVGSNVTGNPLIERWNGSSWSRVLPAVSVNVALKSVFCNSTTDCWAVGARNASNPLILRWNGSTWTRVLPTASVNVDLNSVYCNSSTDCWAVGANNASNPLIERWNGSTWSRVTPTASVNRPLYGVFCNSSSDCWAVGQSISSNLLILRWDGTNWAATSPSVASSATLYSVSCINAKECWAVGSSSTFARWEGSSWALVSAPGGFPSVQLNSVSLIGAKQKPASAWTQVFG